MTDLDLIRELRPEEALAGPGELAGARELLAAAIAAEISADGAAGGSRSEPRPATPRARPPHRAPRRAPHRTRWALAGLAATAAAACAAAAVLVAGQSSPASRTAGPPAHPLAGRLTAARFLAAAAHAALQLPAGPPRPGQWVYSETEDANGVRTQTWLSADGSQAGVVRTSRAAPAPSGSPAPAGTPPGPGNGIPACTAAQAASAGCYPAAGYFPGLPTQPGAVLAYLSRIQLARDQAPPGEGASWLANDLGKAMMTLMGQAYLRPAQRAALYELMARTPGFTVVPGVRDATGRAGVGIEWVYEGGRAVNIFDPKTYAYLGVRTWPAAGYHGPAAHQYDGSALIQIAVVDHSGQLP